MKIWSFLDEKLTRNIPCVLLVVVESEGETPGRRGFKMVVSIDQELCGTIGGGTMEHQLVELARFILLDPAAQPMIKRQIHNETADSDASGMICGGSQTVVLYPYPISGAPAVRRIREALAANETGTLVLTESGLRWLTPLSPGEEYSFEKTPDGFIYRERVDPRDTVYLIGGGHVSLALSQILSMLEMRIVVLDDRPEVDSLVNNHFADQKIITPFDAVAAPVLEGEHSYAVIMTPSHRADESVLRQLVRKQLRYLGMMASPKKAKEIIEHLQREGVEDHHLGRVRTPVGLAIHSRTPAEIAVSIAAEIIKERNGER